MSKKTALVLLSGGMDSATCAFIAKQDFDIVTLFCKYGQRTENRELSSFKNLSKALGVKDSIVVELPFYKKIGGSALTDNSIDVPKEDGDDIPVSYVPFRNGVLLSIASAHAEVMGIHDIFIGAVWEDSSGYPDCREEFLKQIEKAINLGMRPESAINIHYPVIHKTKTEIIKTGMSLGVPFEHTWSCYSSNETPCGECPSCTLRAKAFEAAKCVDPAVK